MSSKIKVAGYVQGITYNGSISYRPFGTNVTSGQVPSSGDTSIFTNGMFAITTNLDPKTDKQFGSNKFSNFVSLDSLKLTPQENTTLLDNNASVILNLDPRNLSNYALFGSLKERIRVALENIITNWPASLYINSVYSVNNDIGSATGNTFELYTYNLLSNESTFRVQTAVINNQFEINYQQNGSILNTFNETNDLRNLAINYASYCIIYNNVECDVIGFTGSTSKTNDYIYFRVKGNVFSSATQQVSYHIKPAKNLVESFFNSLDDLEVYLLNRRVLPLYTAEFKYPYKSESGMLLYVSETVSWPLSDGYNIDFSTDQYNNYVSKLLDIASNNDETTSNLMNRFLVAENITDFDTSPIRLPDTDDDDGGARINKLLQIYGVELDQLNKYIKGISFANVVTYDKFDNTPDIFVKNIARVLGWDLVSSVLDNDLLKNYLTPKSTSYSGLSIGLTPAEADIELWRRLILNTPWIWKSKGTRNPIEFLLRFIGTPKGLVTFNEHVYLADKPIDIELFEKVLKLNGLDTDLSRYPIDENGYPKPLPNTPDMYFQNNGLWYRETGGSGSTVDILNGNNPHVGPYDGGFKYINQFKSLIPNFSAVTISSETISSSSTNLFTNYNNGIFNGFGKVGYLVNCVTNLDFNVIRQNQLDSCATGATDDCVVVSKWNVVGYLDNVLKYSGGTFYSGTSLPTEAQYVAELKNVATAVGVDWLISGSTFSFVDISTTCNPNSLFENKNLKVNLCLDINYSCS